MHGLVIAAAAAATLFRIVPLSCGGDRLTVAGGGVLRLAEGATCESVRPGRAIAIVIDDQGRVTPRALDVTAKPAAEIPRSAYLLAPAAERDADETQAVIVTIDVTVPARTPAGDDIYISTERSNWSPTEIRMNQVDARHYRLEMKVRRGARVPFRISRGSTATTERDQSRALPPAHLASGEPGAHVSVTVAAWADID